MQRISLSLRVVYELPASLIPIVLYMLCRAYVRRSIRAMMPAGGQNQQSV